VSGVLQQILFVVIVLTVAVLMVVDVARTRHEGTHGHAELPPFDVKRPVANVGVGSREPFSAAHARTAAPAAGLGAGHAGLGTGQAGRDPSVAGRDPSVAGRDPSVAGRDPALAGRPAAASLPAGADARSPADAPAVPRESRRRLRDTHVRSRLWLLVIVPLAAAAVVALGVAYLIDVLSKSQADSSGAGRAAVAVGVVVIVAALASWFSIVVARSVLQPLYRLRQGAQELTGARLADALHRASQGNARSDGAPSDLKPIGSDASDEIGEIARSVDELRGNLLRLAAGEAAHHGSLNETLVELSHRGQSLMERQIRLLQHAEQGEPDRERLATLWRVQRIGSRMHRYSENLLVLVGHEPSGGLNQPVLLANVIRAAVSELEEYQRVSVNAQPDVAIVGPAVNDVLHLIIELTENATSFSAADMLVDVSGRVLNSGGVLLEISDRGVGMTPKELEYANWRLENPPAANANIPKWIGLLVVARLAARQGIAVRLQAADYGGLTALVWLPDEILTGQGAMVAARPRAFAGAGSRRDLREAVPNLADATGQREATRARFVPPPETIRDTPPDRRPVPDVGLPSGEYADAADQPDPNRRNVPAEGIPDRNFAAAPLSQNTLSQNTLSQNTPRQNAPSLDTSPAAGGVIVPPAGDVRGEQQLPVFNALESSWFRDGRDAPSSPGGASAAGNRWSSPADAGWHAAHVADSPSSAGSTTAGLPRRSPSANLVPGAIPSTEPAALPSRSAAAAQERLAALQRGTDKARSVTRQAAAPGENDETQPGTPR
jgi:signal transduction histidine kinase